MPSHRGVDYQTRTKLHPVTNKYLGEMSLSVSNGYEMMEHPFVYITVQDSLELAQFISEEEAELAAGEVAVATINQFF